MDGWEFWIDVGGTFTDCIARHSSGELRRHKTLSSGVIKGTVHLGSDRIQLIDPLRRPDPANFWVGWQLRLLDSQGSPLASRTVVDFDRSAASLLLDTPLSTVPRVGQSYELDAGLEAPLVAIRYLLHCPLDQSLPNSSVRLGTTLGTNALLTRQGARVAWITTKGFGDLLRIGYQARPHLFDLTLHKPAPLYEFVVEIDERVSASGDVLRGLDHSSVRRQLSQLKRTGAESLAIGFLHAYVNPTHEVEVATIAKEVGFDQISLSSDLASLIKLVARGDTTVVNAYLTPVLRDYLAGLADSLVALDTQSFRIMTSAGGLVAADRFQGKDSILSGPAGGVIGCAGAAVAAGFSKAIGFDMGGTSTDVARYDGKFDFEYETEKAGVRVVAPMLAIETVAAGGGSICRFDGVKLAVGPESAGADPGPACYGRGGPLTVTDVNLFLGRLPADALPFPLHTVAVDRPLQELCGRIHQSTGVDYSPAELAAGFLKISNANMAQAIRRVSVAQGFDPRDYVLIAFGGAAPQHACAVARELRIRQILDHADGSVLSALGMGLADVTRHVQQGIYLPLQDVQSSLESRFVELEAEAIRFIADEGIPRSQITARRTLELRYLGTDWPLSIEGSATSDYATRFAEQHRRLYGYDHGNRGLEIVAMRVEAVGHCGWSLPASRREPPRRAVSEDRHRIVFDGEQVDVARFQRGTLRPGDQIEGPAIVVQATSTTVVDPGWSAEMLTEGELLLTDGQPELSTARSVESDPIQLELFNSHFESIAAQMGSTLRKTSSSVNVKERLDFSCAVFDDQGALVVNAPHIPVHLGAMSETVRHLIDDHPNLRPGDVLITNDPFRGGSHLPDVTVVTPVFGHDADTPLEFFVASRAHHAEIGGITPGSMPPFSKCLAEEGVLIRSFKVVEQGRSQLDRLKRLLTGAPYPSRDVESNLADVRAQIAANQQGVRDLSRLIDRYTWPVVAAYMRHIQTAAETKMRQALVRKGPGNYDFVDHLDDGSCIRVSIQIRGERAKIDFSGSAGVSPNNLNANPAIVTAAVMYCLRCLIDEPIPLNQGVLTPIELVIPEGLLNPVAAEDPASCPAVAGGNVETSQRIVDVLLGALGVAAASQGTMNNLLFGNDRFGYYETICGGAGATPLGRGADAIHTHMTNTRLTDAEVLERNFPIRLHEFAIRRNSGGRGYYNGGCGVVRKLEFLEPLQVSILSQRRGPYAPYGLSGGQPGQIGENRLRRGSQPEERLDGRVHLNVQAGDVLTIETPGGGGFGSPEG